ALNWNNGTSLNDSGLQPGAAYRYDVLTRDNNNQLRGSWNNISATHTVNISTLANPVSVQSITPTYDPSPAQGGTGKGHILTVAVNANGNSASSTYTFRVKNKPIAPATSPYPVYEFINLQQATTYCFTVAANNPGGIQTAESLIVCGSTIDFNDIDPPLFGGIAGISDPQIGGALDLSWEPATDQSVPITYRIYVAASAAGQNFSGSAFTTQNLTFRATTLNNGTPLQNGTPYYFVVHAQDSSPARNTDTNTIELSGIPTRDSIPPPMDLDPEGAQIAINGVITGINHITVSGKTEPGATVSITNQQASTNTAATVASDGKFSTSVTLIAGTNTLIAVAADFVGNTATQTATVTYDVVPPAASITSPSAGQSISGASVQIVGSVSDDKGIASYKVEYGPGTAPGAYKTIFTGSSAVTSAALATWDTSGLSATYTIKLSATDLVGNATQTSVIVNVFNTTSVTRTLPAGTWTMVGIPGKPLSSNPAAFLGSGNYALRRWDPTISQDDPILFKYLTEFPVGIGNGFWIRPFSSDLSYSLTLEVENTTTAKSVHMANGWNQIGTPFNKNMIWGNVRVKKTGTEQTLSMSDASVNGWIVGGVAYAYLNNGYQQKGPADQLEPGKGYFVKCGANSIVPLGCDLLFDPGADSGGVARIVRGREFDFKLDISARAGDVADTDNYIGIVSGSRVGFDGLDIPEPPAIDPYVSVYFQKDDWKASAGRYAGDVRPPSDGVDSWEFAVDTDLKNEEVRLSFPNAANIPAGYQVTIRDLATGAAVDPLGGDYLFVSGGSPRRFAVAVNAPQQPEETLTRSIKTGWSLITFPVDTSRTDVREQFKDEFRTIHVFQLYDNAYLSPDNAQGVDIQAGVAYWIFSDVEKSLNVTGKTIPESRSISLPLTKGWNLLGDPYTFEIPWGDNISFESDGQSYTIAEARQAGLVSSKLFTYDTAAGYVEYTDSTLKPWAGYFIQAQKPCNLVFSAQTR
ncbi:MAG: Ig-like domain-containing protein, partial [bacterium]